MGLVKIGALDAALGVSGVICLDYDVSFSLFPAAPMPMKDSPSLAGKRVLNRGRRRREREAGVGKAPRLLFYTLPWKQCLLLAGIASG